MCARSVAPTRSSASSNDATSVCASSDESASCTHAVESDGAALCAANNGGSFQFTAVASVGRSIGGNHC